MISKNTEQKIVEALEEKRHYLSGSPFHHYPTFEHCEDDRYACVVEIVKWNTRSTRITRLWARFDEKKGKWIFARKPGQRRIAHGEKMI